VIVEILDRRGRVRSRRRIDALPAYIGRAYDNDVILDDRHVDPLHATLSPADGADRVCWIEDAGSVNGMRIGGRHVSRAPLRSGEEVVLGRTRLRFVAEDHPVPPAIRDAADTRPGIWLRSVPLCLVAIAAGAGVFAIETWLGRHDELRASELVAESLQQLLFVALWGGAWAFASRAIGGESRFFAHAAIASLASIAFIVHSVASEYLLFVLLPGPLLSESTDFLSSSLLVAVILYAHVSLLSRASFRRRAAGVTLVSFGTLGVMSFSEWIANDDFSGRIEFAGELKPFGTSLLPTRTRADFFQSLDTLREHVDALAAEAADDEADAAGADREAGPSASRQPLSRS
jgi:pSer/pThr/pTyr-binding forkhead associated (FHA) protein